MKRCAPTRLVTKRGIHSEQGFTLMETSIALIVMTIVALAASSLFVYAVKYNGGANERALSLAVAQRRMEVMKKASFSDAVLTPGTFNESYTNGGRTYNVTTIVCATADCGGSATSKLITIQVAPAMSGNVWSSTPATIMARHSAIVLGDYYNY